MTASPPTPHQIDEMAREYLAYRENYLQAKLAASEAQQNMELKGELLKQMVADYGSAHAQKSKLLHGVRYEAMCSYAQEVKIDAAAVETFRDALVKGNQRRMLGKLFEKSIRWTLNPQASTIVRGSSTLSDKLRSLFAQCEVVKAKTPSLTVRPKEKAAA